MYSIKSSLLAWWFICILTIFLWYRDYKYDRVIAALAIVLGMIQLIEYGIYNSMSPRQGGKLIFCVIWLLLFIFALSTLIFVRNVMALIWLIIITIFFLLGIFYVFTLDKNDDSLGVTQKGHYLIWFSMLRGLEWVFILGLSIPILLLLDYYEWNDIGLYFILFYLIASGLIVWSVFNSELFMSIWMYSLSGILLLTWFIGMFTP